MADDIIVKVKLDDKGLKDGLEKIAQVTDKFTKNIESLVKTQKKLDEHQKKLNKQFQTEITTRKNLTSAINKETAANTKNEKAAKKAAEQQKVLRQNSVLFKKEIEQLEFGLSKLGLSFKDLKITQETLKKAQQGHSKQMSQIRKAVQLTNKEIKQQNDTLENNQQKYRNIIQQLRNLGISQKNVGVSTETLDKAQKGHAKSVQILEKRLKTLKESTRTLTQSQRPLSNSLKNTNPQYKRNATGASALATKHLRLASANKTLSFSFATLRSRMLLFSFAMSLGGRQLARFGQSAAQLESLTRAFETLSGGSLNAAVSLQKLREATNNTVSETDLLTQANNALILGVADNSDKMATLFDMAQRLGRALGRDTRSSVESLITGIGRQSRLMLDNVGIIVKADEAYTQYALKLNKSKDALTQNEKRQAFANAAIEAGRRKVESLGKEVLSTQDKFDTFTASLVNLQNRLGKVINEGLIPIIELSTKFIDSLSVEKLKLMVEITASLSVALVAFKKAAQIAAAGAVLLTGALASVFEVFMGNFHFHKGFSGKGLLGVLRGFVVRIAAAAVSVKALVVVLAGALTFGLLRYFNVFGSGNEETKKLTKNTNNLSKSMKKVSTKEITLELENMITKLREGNEFLELVARSMQRNLIEDFDFDFNLVTPFSLAQKSIEDLKQQIESLEKEKLEIIPVVGGTFGAVSPQQTAQIDEIDAEIDILNTKLKQTENTIKFGILGAFEDDALRMNLDAFSAKFEEITGITSAGFFQGDELEATANLIGNVITTEEELLAVLNAIKDSEEELNATYLEGIVIKTQKTEKNKELADALKLVEKATKDTLETEAKNIANAIAILQTKTSLTDGEAKALANLELQQKRVTILRRLENDHLYQQADAYAQVGESILAVGKVAGMHQKDMLNLQMIVAIANAYKAASDTWADTTIQPTILRAAAAASHFASAYANVRGIHNQMQKIDGGGGSSGTGTATPVLSFEQGGYIGGRRHSQGGTIIEAEQGEFIMSRNAVESIGLETLNQMNQGGSANNIVVNVSGNVMTQDFVEGELAESIKEAVRRGSDFGIN